MGRDPGIPTEIATKRLIEKTAQGDQQAFEELCRAYENRLFRAALDIVHEHDMASDVMQEVRLGIWEASKNYKGDSQPLTWMWAIVRHKAIGALRRRLRGAGFTELQAGDDLSRVTAELDAVIGDALQKLSPEYRLVVVLTYYLNLSQYHISLLLECPVGTVKSRLSSALKQLRKALGTPLNLESFHGGGNSPRRRRHPSE
jgi:RNA polymerase sigma-70 factor (ECF subfamily)